MTKNNDEIIDFIKKKLGELDDISHNWSGSSQEHQYIEGKYDAYVGVLEFVDGKDHSDEKYNA